MIHTILQLKRTKTGSPVLAGIVWTVLLAAGAFADDAAMLSRAEESAFDALEVYIDRADLEQTGAAWLDRAEDGLAAVTAGREKRLNDYVNRRFNAWLEDRFFRTRNKLDLEMFYESVENASLDYLYVVDGSGAVRFDSAGDPLLKDSAGLADDRVSWRSAVEGNAREVLRAWERNARAEQAELLSVLGDKRGGGQFAETIAEYREGMRRQLNRLISAEESRFIAKRLRDQFSLRKKSDQKTASVMVDELIEDVEERLEEGLDTLRQGQLPESFTGEIERGLEKWARAEEKLLAERAAWERDLGADFKEAERGWLEAFRRLEEARLSWEREFSSILEEGRREWADKEEAFAEALQEARAELERSAERQSGSVKERIENLVAMYLEGKQTIRTAKSSGDHWIGKIREELGGSPAVFGSPGSYELLREGFLHHLGHERERLEDEARGSRTDRQRDLAVTARASAFAEYAARTWRGDWSETPDNTRWDELYRQYLRDPAGRSTGWNGLTGEEKLRSRAAAREMFRTVSQDLFGAAEGEGRDIYRYKELDYWLSVYEMYTDITESAARELAATYGIVVTGRERDDVSADTSYSGIVDDDEWKNVYLDDYQLELIKAEALVDYRRRQHETAEAVAAYAADTSSDRSTEAETRESYESALDAYGKAKEAYQLAVEKLEAAGGDAAAERDRLKTIREELDGLSAALGEKESRYKSAMDMYITENNSYYQEKIRGLYDRLLALYGEEGRVVQADYFAAAGRYRLERNLSSAADRLLELINGTGTSGGPTPSLKTLKENAESARSWVFDPGRPGRFDESLKEGFGIGPDHPFYEVLTGEFAAYTEAAAADDHGSAAYHRRRIDAITGELTLIYEQELRGRTDAIAYIGSSDFDFWSDSPALDTAEAAYYRARAEKEKEVLLSLDDAGRGENPPAGLAAALEKSGLFEDPEGPESPDAPERIQSRIAELDEIILFLRENNRVPGPDALSGYAREFFTGRGMFFIDGVDVLVPELTEEITRRRTAESRLSVTASNRRYAPREAVRLTEEVFEKVGVLLEKYHLAEREEENDAESGLVILSPAAWREKLEESGYADEQKEEQLAGLLAKCRKTAESLPAYMEEEIERFLSALADSYALLTGQSDRDGAEKDYRAYLTETFLGTDLPPGDEEVTSDYTDAAAAVTDPEEYFGEFLPGGNKPLSFYESAAPLLNDVSALSGDSGYDFGTMRDAAEALSAEFGPSVSVEAEYQKQSRARHNIRRETDYLKTEIARLGSSLDTYLRDRDRMMDDIILPLEKEIAGLKEEYRETQQKWNRAADSFRSASRSYSNMCEAVNRREQEQEAASFALEKAEAILGFASSGYRDASAAPAQRLDETFSHLQNAESVLTALRALHGDNPPEDFMHHQKNSAYREAFDQYENHYRNMIALKQLNGFVSEAVAKQKETVRQVESRVEEAAGEVFGAGVLNESSSDYVNDGELDAWFRTMNDELRRSGIGELKEWGLHYWHENASDKSGEIELAAGNTWSKDERISTGCERAVRGDAKRASGGDEYDFYISLYKKGLVDETGFLEDAARLAVQEHLYGEFRSRERKYEKEAKSHWKTVEKLAKLALIPGFGVLFLPAIAVHTAEALGAEDEAEEWEEVRKEIARLRKGSRRIVENSARDLQEKVGTYVDDKDDLLEQESILATLRGERPAGSETPLSIDTVIDSIMEAGAVAGENAGAFIGLEGADKTEMEEALRTLLVETGYAASLNDSDRKSSKEILSSLALIAESEKRNAESILRARTEELKTRQRDAVEAYTRTLHAEKEIRSGAPPEHESPTVPDPAPEGDGISEELSAAMQTAFGTAGFRESLHLGRLYELEQDLGGQVDSVRFAFTAPVERELVAAVSRDLFSMEQGRSRMFLEAHEARWRQKALALAEKKTRWEKTMAAIESRGTAGWRRGVDRLETARGRWMENYRREYRRRSTLWDRTYLAFKEEQNEWVRQAVEKRAHSVSESALREFAAETETSIRKITTVIIPKVETTIPDPKEMIVEITGGNDFAGMLAAGRTANRSITTLNLGIYAAAAASRNYVSDSVLTAVSRFQNIRWGEIEKHVALLTADQARQAVEKAVTEAAESVTEANSSVDAGVAGELYRAGYHRNGSNFLRTALVDDTLFGGKDHEEQKIREYKNYRMPDVVFGVDLSVNTLKKLSPDGVEAQIDNALEELQEFQKKIFGEEDSDDEGWFDQHVGDPAEPAEDADIENTIEENLENKGTGELGRIFTAFWKNEFTVKKGWSEFYKPDYDKRLWDDDGSIIKAPTLRTVADLAVGTAAAVLLPGAGNLLVAAALNISDDLLFTAMDMAEGRVSVEKGLTGLGSKALTSIAASAAGNAYSALGSSLGKAGLNGMGKTALKGLELFQTNLARGAVGAIEWDDDLGSIDFNTEKFTGSIIGERAIAGYIGGMAGTLLEGNLEGFSAVDSGELRQFTGFAGGAIQAGAEYGLTGSTTLNIANIADIGGVLGMDSMPRSGLFEMELSEDNAAEFRFGRSGVDAGFSAVAGAVKGLEVWKEQVRIGAYDAFGTASGSVRFAEDYDGHRGTGTAMRELYSFGDEMGLRRYEDLLSGDSGLMVGFSGDGEPGSAMQEGFRGRTALTGPNGTKGGTGPRMMTYLSSLGAKGDQGSRLRAGITLQHEAWRDGVVNPADVQFLETARSVFAHTEMALEVAGEYGGSIITGDPALTADVGAYLKGPAALVNRAAAGYDGRDDFWKLTVFDEHRAGESSHRLTDDGSRDLTVEYLRRGGRGGSGPDDAEDVVFGTERFEDRTGSWAASLTNALGLERARELLGGDLSRLSLYDDQTLRDVLGFSRDDLRHDPGFSFADLTMGEKLKLAGEALLKSHGSSWDPAGGAWTGLEGLELTMTDNVLLGQLAVDQLPDGSFERFTVTADIIRNEESYSSFYTKSLPSSENNKGLDRAHFYKQDLSGSMLADHTVSGLQTVDVYDRMQEYFGDDDDELIYQVDRDQPYDHPYFGNIQGNTINSSSFGMRVEDDGNFVLHDASAISGDGVDWQGLNHDIGGGRWLWHSGTWQNSDGCFIPPEQEHAALLDVLENWGVPSGYDIESALYGTSGDYQPASDYWHGY